MGNVSSNKISGDNLIKWYIIMKSSMQRVRTWIYILIFKTYVYQDIIDNENLHVIWNDVNPNIDSDATLYSIMVELLNKKGKKGSEKQFMHLLDSMINDIIMIPGGININSDVVLSFFNSKYIELINVNQMYTLVIGCEMANDNACLRGFMYSGLGIPRIIKQIADILKGMDTTENVSKETAIVYDEAIPGMTVMLRELVYQWIKMYPEHQRILEFTQTPPLIIGVMFQYYVEKKELTKQLMQSFIDSLLKNDVNKEMKHNDKMLQVWKIFFNPKALELLEVKHVVKMMQIMNQQMPVPIMIYNSVIYRIFKSKNVSIKLLDDLIEFGYYSISEFNAESFNLFFEYFNEISDVEVMHQILVMKIIDIIAEIKEVNINPKLFRNIIKSFIKYDLKINSKSMQYIVSKM